MNLNNIEINFNNKQLNSETSDEDIQWLLSTIGAMYKIIDKKLNDEDNKKLNATLRECFKFANTNLEKVNHCFNAQMLKEVLTTEVKELSDLTEDQKNLTVILLSAAIIQINNCVEFPTAPLMVFGNIREKTINAYSGQNNDYIIDLFSNMWVVLAIGFSISNNKEKQIGNNITITDSNEHVSFEVKFKNDVLEYFKISFEETNLNPKTNFFYDCVTNTHFVREENLNTFIPRHIEFVKKEKEKKKTEVQPENISDIFSKLLESV